MIGGAVLLRIRVRDRVDVSVREDRIVDDEADETAIHRLRNNKVQLKADKDKGKKLEEEFAAVRRIAGNARAVGKLSRAKN